MNYLLRNNISKKDQKKKKKEITFHSFIQQDLLGAYYVSITVPGIWDRPVNKTKIYVLK